MYFWSANFFIIIIERKTGPYLPVQLPEIICGTDISRNTTVVMDSDNDVKYISPHGRYELNKLNSLLMCGFIARLVKHDRTGIAEVTGSNPVEALIFSGFFFPIHHFTVVCLVTWPLNGSEAGVDLVLIQTSLLLMRKSGSSYAN